MRLVNVTAADIKHGQANIKRGLRKSTNCAISLALQRVFHVEHIFWGYYTGSVGTKNICVFSDERDIVVKFVFKHDRLEKVKPFKFYVEDQKSA